MNFTREPIIETIVTPKEGYKLLVRSSKHTQSEDYQVDAIEIVSFGQALFYRSLERPKEFLLPVGDFEILEVREARVPLKKASVERTIKIAGGKESSKDESTKDGDDAPPKRKERKRTKRKKTTAEAKDKEHSEPNKASKSQDENHETPDDIPPTLVTSSLIPPPSSLISDSISRYKDLMQDDTGADGNVDQIWSVDVNSVEKTIKDQETAPAENSPESDVADETASISQEEGPSES